MRKLSKPLSLGIFLFLAAISYGQLGKGVITGTVTDPSGAVVPGAAVTIVSQATAVQRIDTTNLQGIYRFDFADVGTYTLKVSSAGFANSELTGLVLTVGETVTSDVRLEVAQTAQTITVAAGGVQLVQTENSEVSGLVSRNTLAQLPLDVRDPIAFVNLLPGSVPSSLGNVEFNGSTRGSAVNGARGGMGNFTIDGFDNNDQGQGGRGHNTVGSIPGAITGISPDAIQEFRVITNNFSAQYGRQGGFVADAVLRSGTNKIHGSAFEYNRNQAITANDFFSNRLGTKDALVRNQFGGSLGAPIRKDKTFIFGTVEIQRLRQSAPNVTTSVTPDFINFVKTGAFAAYNEVDPGGFCRQVVGSACPGAFASTKTLGPIAGGLLSQFPAPVPVSNFTNASGGEAPSFFGVPINYPVNMFGQVDIRNNTVFNENRFSFKFDHDLGPRDRLSAIYAFDDFDTTNSSLGTDENPGGSPFFPEVNFARSQNAGLNWTHTISPTLLNEFKFSYLRSNLTTARPVSPEVPSIIQAFDSLTYAFGGTSRIPQLFTDNQFQYQDDLAYAHGLHSLKFGFQYRRTRNGSIYANVRDGLFYFYDTENLLTDGAYGDIVDSLTSSNLGSFYAAEASVNPETGQKPEYYRGYRANEFGSYVQDDWKVRPRLTLNLGLRWDYFGVPHNFRPGFDSNFYYGPATIPIVTTSNNPFFPLNSVPYAHEATATFMQKNSNLWNKDINNFAPRFGFAWDARGNQKTIVRGGAGIFYDRIWNNLYENIRFNPPLFSVATLGQLGSSPASPVITPGLYTIPIDTALFNNPAYQPKPSPRHMDQNIVSPYLEQVSFGVQQQFSNNMVLEMDYIGTFGHKLTAVIDLNTFDGRTVGAPYSSRRPNSTIGTDNARGNYFNSSYHAFQVKLTQRLSRGLQFESNYTYSKALDYVSDAFFNRAAVNNQGGAGVMDPENWRLDYGRADFDLRHRFVTNVLYDIPLWKTNRWAGGWSIASVFELQTGLPFTIYNGGADYNHDGHFIDRPDYVGLGPLYTRIDRTHSPADGYIAASLFAAPTLDPSINMGLWRDGSLGRNVISGPGLCNMDFSLKKSFRLTERASLQLQFNFFNIFNRTNYALPEGNLNSSNFGLSTADFGPRIGQVAARIDF